MHVTDRKGTPILGKRVRAEQLVDWSIEGEPGRRYTQAFPCGLKLNFVSNGTAPRMYLHWNPEVFSKFMASIGKFERLVLNCWGVCVSHYKGNTTVRLLGAGAGPKSAAILWDTDRPFCQEQTGQDVDFLTGVVRFAETGPEFTEDIACQQELEEAAAVAVIHVPASKTLPTRVLTSRVLDNTTPRALVPEPQNKIMGVVV